MQSQALVECVLVEVVEPLELDGDISTQGVEIGGGSGARAVEESIQPQRLGRDPGDGRELVPVVAARLEAHRMVADHADRRLGETLPDLARTAPRVRAGLDGRSW